VRREWSAGQVLLDQFRLAWLGISHEPLRMWYTPQMPLWRWPLGWLFWLGLFGLLWRPQLRGLLLGLPLTTAVLLTALSQDTPAAQRFVVIAVLSVFVVALPSGWLWAWLKEQNWLSQNMKQGATAVFLCAILWLAMADVRFYFGELDNFYTLGGVNTAVATELAIFLRPQAPHDVYFLGHPRMNYASHATVPYLAPHMHGRDLNDPLTAPPLWLLRQPSIFVFLPERLAELTYVQEAFPHGRVQQHYRPPFPDPLFTTYQINNEQ
jgi:hypothetical protein